MRLFRALALTFAASALSCSPSSDEGGSTPGPSVPPPPQGDLVLVSTSPEASETGVPLDQPIEITFSLPLGFMSVNDATISFESPYGPIPGTVSLWFDMIRFEPLEDLPPSVPITGTITTGVIATNGDTLDDEFTWTFTTRHAPVVVHSESGLEQAQVATWDSGYVLVAAVTFNRIVTRSFRPELGWADQPVNLQESAAVSNLALFKLDDEDAVFLWTVPGSGSTMNIRTARFVPGSGWQDVETLATGLQSGYGNPAFAIHPQGAGIVGYVIAPASRLFRYREPDGTWLEAADLPDGDGWGLKLAVDGDGIVSAAFTGDYHPALGFINMRAARFTPASGWTTTTFTPAMSPLNVGDSENSAVITAQYGSEIRTWCFLSGTWTSLAPIQRGLAPIQTRFAIGPTGDGVSVWREYSNGVTTTYGALLQSGVQWLGVQSLGSGNTLSDLPAAACDADGRGTIVYSRHDTVRSIWLARGVPLLGWEEPVVIDEDNLDSYSPAVSVSAAGGAAAWMRTSTTSQLVVRMLD